MNGIKEQSKCAWCDKEISDGIFAVLAKVTGEILNTEIFKRNEGSEIEMFFPSMSKEIRVLIAGRDSQAKKEGWDIILTTCSDDCHEYLKNAIANEKLLLKIDH